MADAILHIKDSYYFEVPKLLWRSHRSEIEEFPEFWVRLDPDYQMWEAERIYDGLKGVAQGLDEHGKTELLAQYNAWRHADHHNLGKPFDRFLTEAPGTEWFQTQLQPTLEVTKTNAEGKRVTETVTNESYNPELAGQWSQILAQAEDVQSYIAQAHWSDAKIEAYNSQLDGKILIPQPFGQLRNLYQSESGFAISKFMIVEFVLAILIAAFFIFVASRLRKGGAPRGKFVNAMEAMLLFMRDEIARPAIGAHDASRFVPLLWTIFFFVLG
jgi:F-type H+-transporting ATPase subunit a